MSTTASRQQYPNLLAFDVSSNACSIALLPNGLSFPDQVIESHIVAPMQQAKLILPEIEKLLNLASITIEELGALAFGCGPGSFTGLRLACSVVQAVGFKVNIPIIPVSSLAALAQTVHMQTGWERVLVVLDARKDQVYRAAYEVDNNGVMQSVVSESLVSVHEVRLDDYKDWYFAGDGVDLCSGNTNFMGEIADRKSAIQAPSAKAMLPIAMLRLTEGKWISPSDAIPVYLNPYKS